MYEMDRLIVEWILRHALKHSYTRVIKEISCGWSNFECGSTLGGFVLYATCIKLHATKNCLDFDDRRMLRSALTKFVDSFPQISESKIFNDYEEMLFILKWTIRVQIIISSFSNPFLCDVAALKAENEIFESELSTMGVDSPLPCKDVFKEVKLTLLREPSGIVNAYLKLIKVLSVHILSILGRCIEPMRLLLPSTPIEEMQHTLLSYPLEGLTALPENNLKRLECICAMVKRDSSEESLLQIIKLMQKISIENSADSVINRNQTVFQTLEDLNAHAEGVVNFYIERLQHYKKLYMAMKALNSDTCGHSEALMQLSLESTSSDNTAVNIETQEENCGEYLRDRESEDNPHVLSGINPNVTIRSKVEKHRDSTICSAGRGEVDEIVGSVTMTESHTHKSSVGKQQIITEQSGQRVESDCSELKEAKCQERSSNEVPSVSSKEEIVEGLVSSLTPENTQKEDLNYMSSDQVIVEIEDGCLMRTLSPSEFQFSCSLESLSETSEGNDQSVEINAENQKGNLHLQSLHSEIRPEVTSGLVSVTDTIEESTGCPVPRNEPREGFISDDNPQSMEQVDNECVIPPVTTHSELQSSCTSKDSSQTSELNIKASGTNVEMSEGSGDRNPSCSMRQIEKQTKPHVKRMKRNSSSSLHGDDAGGNVDVKDVCVNDDCMITEVSGSDIYLSCSSEVFKEAAKKEETYHVKQSNESKGRLKRCLDALNETDASQTMGNDKGVRVEDGYIAAPVSSNEVYFSFSEASGSGETDG